MRTMDRNRALEIIAACGGDPLRWPAGERAALTALIADDAGLRAAQVDAAPLDAALVAWGAAEIAGGQAETAADAALAALPGPQRWWGVAAAGGALAASVALAIAVLPPQVTPTVPTRPVPTVTADVPAAVTVAKPDMQVVAAPPTATPTTAAAAQTDAEALAYAMLFTETPEEEITI